MSRFVISRWGSEWLLPLYEQYPALKVRVQEIGQVNARDSKVDILLRHGRLRGKAGYDGQHIVRQSMRFQKSNDRICKFFRHFRYCCSNTFRPTW